MTAAANLGDIVIRDAVWMFSNLVLAWAGVLFAMLALRARAHVRGHARGRNLSRILSWLAVAAAVAFAPNAPYVLTDGMHYVQDLRRVRLDFTDAAILAITYGWFLTLGVTAWIVLLDVARRIMPVRAHGVGLVLASLLAAMAIYVGRIPRVHSWHLVTDPVDAVRPFFDIILHPGPAVFALVWTCVVAAVSVVGLWSLVRARRATPPVHPVALVVGWAWLLAGSLLSAMPLVGLLDPEFGLATSRALPRDEVLAVLAGVPLAAYGLRLMGVLRLGRAMQVIVAAAPVLALGTVLVGASTLGWWAQYRALCEYGPKGTVHLERCD